MQTDYGTFAHLAADKRHRYREVLGVFAGAKARFVLHLRPSDVVAAMPTRVDVDEVEAALRQLVGWGNLSADRTPPRWPRSRSSIAPASCAD